MRVKITTRKFGEIDIDSGKVLRMPEGLLGFPGFETFILIEDPKTTPFSWFQSVEEPDLALAVISPYIFEPDYSVDLTDVIKGRQWEISQEKLLIYVVVNISNRDNHKTITANLIGPLVINPEINEVVQFVISDTSYSHQHVIVSS